MHVATGLRFKNGVPWRLITSNMRRLSCVRSQRELNIVTQAMADMSGVNYEVLRIYRKTHELASEVKVAHRLARCRHRS